MESTNRQIALKLILEQIDNACYLLERKEYDNFSQAEINDIANKMETISQQFKKRYSLDALGMIRK